MRALPINLSNENGRVGSTIHVEQTESMENEDDTKNEDYDSTDEIKIKDNIVREALEENGNSEIEDNSMANGITIDAEEIEIKNEILLNTEVVGTESIESIQIEELGISKENGTVSVSSVDKNGHN